MRLTLQRAVTGIVLAVTIVASAFAYPTLPAQLIVHWGVTGAPNGTLPRLTGAFAVPAIAAVTALSLFFAERAGQRGETLRSFRGTYEWAITGVVVLLCGLQGIVLSVNLGYVVPFSDSVVPLVGAILLVAAGFVLERTERNRFLGVRTPWTLADDEVWHDTHERAGVASKVAGVLSLAGYFLPAYAVTIVIGLAVVVALYACAYSFFDYRAKYTV